MSAPDLFDGEMHAVETAPLREADIQAKCVDYMRGLGAYARKFASPANRSVPDYIFTWRGLTWYVEFKRPGKVPTKAQANEHAKIREAQGVVWLIDDVGDFKMRIELTLRNGALYEE